MGILSITTDVAGQVDVNPRRVKIVTTDSLNKVTTAGYLNGASTQGLTIKPTDFIDMVYNYASPNSPGTTASFTVSIAGTGAITLLPYAADANALLNNIVNTMAAGGEIILDKATATTTAGAATVNKQSAVLTTPALTTAGGASYVITFTNSEIATTSVLLVSLMGGTNTVENISVTAVPAAGSATITIYNNTAATPLNGTVILGVVVF